MKPENIKLAEELDFEGPVSFLLNRAGKRIVGCSTQALWNLVTLLHEWPEGADPMDGLMTIRAGIKEDFTSQGASHEATVAYLKSESIFMENVVDTIHIHKLTNMTIKHHVPYHHNSDWFWFWSNI
jgi:hypothetical protein